MPLCSVLIPRVPDGFLGLLVQIEVVKGVLGQGVVWAADLVAPGEHAWVEVGGHVNLVLECEAELEGGGGVDFASPHQRARRGAPSADTAEPVLGKSLGVVLHEEETSEILGICAGPPSDGDVCVEVKSLARCDCEWVLAQIFVVVPDEVNLVAVDIEVLLDNLLPVERVVILLK